MNKDAVFDAAHFDRVSAAYDKFLPYIQPVTEAILGRLTRLPEGSTVLDLACGTGEPGLSVARRHPGIRLLGVDAAEGMLAIARRKADAEALGNAHFQAMPLDTMTLADGSAEAAISRFGFLLFGDPAAAATELARVLKPGSPFSLAVWENMADNTFFDTAVQALGSQCRPEQMPNFSQFDALAETGRRERWLRDAGVGQIETELFHWTYDFPDFEVVWDAVCGPGMFADHVAQLDEAQRTDMHRHLSELLAPHREADGSYRVPETCRLFWGQR